MSGQSAPVFAPVKPVPGRECGACVVCCIVPEIRDTELQKPAGKLCDYLCRDGGGCAIHDAMPPKTCREFFCGWRMIPDLGDEWRPDLSGVMLTAPPGGAPMEMVAQGAMQIVLIERRAINWAPLISFILKRLDTTPFYVSVAGKEGRQTFVAYISDEIAGGDGGDIMACLESVWDNIARMMTE